MKQVILVRHAKAMEPEEGLPDFVRSLVKRGIRQAKRMSGKLRKFGALPELFISSPANRALETAQRFARAYDYPRKKIVLQDELYNPVSEEKFCSIIKETGDDYRSIIFFGHDPVISNMAKYLAKDFDENLPPCAVVVLEFYIESFKDISKGEGEVLFYEYPRRVRKYFNQMKIDIEADLFEKIMEVFKKTNADVAAVEVKNIKEWVSKAAARFIQAIRKYRVKQSRNEITGQNEMQENKEFRKPKTSNAEKTGEEST